MEARLGVISPQGDFYPCGHGCHKALSAQIWEKLDLPPSLRMYETLQEQGWIFLWWHFGTFSVGPKTPSSIQQDVVDKLVMEWMCVPDEDILSTIMRNDESLKSDVYITPVPPNSEELRKSLLEAHSDHLQKASVVKTPSLWNK